MSRLLRGWVITCGVLAALLVVGSWLLARRASLAPYEQAELFQSLSVGLALSVVALGVALTQRRLAALIDGSSELAAFPARHPRLAVFAASFAALFVEMLLIRYASAQIRVFAFYKNVPLVAAFLGLGIGCFLERGRPRHGILFALWTVPAVVILAHGAPLFDGWIGGLAARASSEHILGDVGNAGGAHGVAVLWKQLCMAGLCGAALLAIGSWFGLLGRIVGETLEHVPRLTGYGWNLAGSLAGVVVFAAASFAWTPPAVWFAIGLAPLLLWTADRRQTVLLCVLIALVALLVTPSVGETIWSPYQKLVGHGRPDSTEYRVNISDVFYQVAVDLSPAAVAQRGSDPFPHYSEIYLAVPKPKRVLVVGAGTGNDVAAALRAGAEQVDAVEIDPAIVKLGRDHHPEHPYDDARVQVVVADARAAFRTLPSQSYDLVVFGLLDSHTQLGMSSVRLDNYVFTRESFAAARRLVRPGGNLVVSAAVFQQWFHERFSALMAEACDGPTRLLVTGSWNTYLCQIADPGREQAAVATGLDLPMDDWPFLYLPKRGIPVAYWFALGALAAASLLLFRFAGLGVSGVTTRRAHLFFLGAGFVLLEVHAINRLALLFGTTWIVSAAAIAVVLLLAFLANATVALAGQVPYVAVHVALAASLVASYATPPTAFVGRGTAAALAYGVILLLPLYFGGLVFARSFRESARAGPAIGANMLGAALGAWLEYGTMIAGIRSMVIVAMALYAASAVALVAAGRRSLGRGEG